MVVHIEILKRIFVTFLYLFVCFSPAFMLTLIWPCDKFNKFVIVQICMQSSMTMIIVSFDMR